MNNMAVQSETIVTMRRKANKCMHVGGEAAVSNTCRYCC